MRTSQDEVLSASESGDEASGASPATRPIEPTKLTSPCHDARCCGGPARVWCPECGRSFQADELAVTAPVR